MELRTLTACLDDSDGARARLAFALDLATRHGAHLDALHLSYMPGPTYVAEDGVQRLYDSLQQDLAARQAAARDAFLAAARARGLSAAFAAARSLDMAAATAHARASDLVIAGRPVPGDSSGYIGEGFPSRFLLELGRPVLFLPPGTPVAAAFGHVMVAWNGSRESTRALFDALPLLRQARRVTLLTLHAGERPPAALPPADPAALLRRHGIEATLVEAAGPGAGRHDDAGRWLLARASEGDDPADLLVAGAYGHSRFAELVLGGVTRTLLDSAPLPVLLSH